VRYAPRQTSPEEIQSVIKTEAGFDSVIVSGNRLRPD
jgi:hypothetical protein